MPSSMVADLQARMAPYMAADEHNRNGEPYMVCNIYYDTPTDNVIRTSVARPKYKEKLRLRSYGTPTPDDQIFLELKKKFDGVGTKRRARMTLREAEAYLQNGVHPAGPSLSYMDEQVLREIDYYRSHTDVSPALYVSYLRHAYHGKEDPSFRVTLDSEILTRRYDLDLTLGRYGDPILSPGKTLLEVKFEGAVPLWFSRVMSDLGLSFHTFSKCGTDFKLYAYDKAVQSGDEFRYLRLIH